MCVRQNDVAEAYMDLLEMAENCKDPTEKAKLDWILLRFANHFGAIEDKKDSFSIDQYRLFTDFVMCGKYTFSREYELNENHYIVDYTVFKYEPTEEYKSKFQRR